MPRSESIPMNTTNAHTIWYASGKLLPPAYKILGVPVVFGILASRHVLVHPLPTDTTRKGSTRPHLPPPFILLHSFPFCLPPIPSHRTIPLY
jgi:hypothetical protein